MTRYHDEVCQVLCEDNDKIFTAEILEFKEGKFLSVSLERQLKINLSWNGRVYEGRLSGRSFVSNGPKVIETKDGRNA